MVTIKDIAKQAGVSQGTVSNVLNGRGNVSSEKIRLVEEACRLLDYIPNERAKALRRGSGRMLGVIVPPLEEKRHTDFFAGFRAYAESHGYGARLYVLRSDDRDAEEACARRRATGSAASPCSPAAAARRPPRRTGALPSCMWSTPCPAAATPSALTRPRPGAPSPGRSLKRAAPP